MAYSWRSAVAFAAVILTFSPAAAPAADDADGIAPPRFGAWGYDFAGQDLTVKPGTDFFLHTNGNWLKRAEIPADKSISGNFNALRDFSNATVRKLIEDAAAGRSDDPDAAKIGAAYRAYMDEARPEQLDAAPLAADLAAIRGEKSKADVVALMGEAVRGSQAPGDPMYLAPEKRVRIW